MSDRQWESPESFRMVHHSEESEPAEGLGEPEDFNRGPEPSINGNSIEVTHRGSSRTSGSGGDLIRLGSGSRRHRGARQVRERVWEDMANKLLPPEGSALMKKYMEKDPDERLVESYIDGVYLPDVAENAPVPRIGIVFLAGGDKPQVNRLEEKGMTSGAQDQQNARWRVHTAASLLFRLDVTRDLEVVKTYDFQQMAAVVGRTKSRRARKNGPASWSSTGSSTGSSQALTRMGSLRTGQVVTIDSDEVRIVKTLAGGEWDLESTLIEVDGSALINLTINYRHLISTGGPDMNYDETKELLDMMIEDARRLCIRSPILFRMSTREVIINSKNTRYGICNRQMFTTLTTSQGIREIISLSAAYFNSLDPDGTADETQKLIRPRFLQMVVLLLSLLNDEDLYAIKDFLEATYKFKADRPHLELLFLKVIPLMSINSKVFLRALVPPFEGFPLPGGVEDEAAWDIFIQRILIQGYLLPGTTTDLGRERHSWIVKWPEDGFKSTSVFKDLQYAGPKARGMNDIPAFQIHPESLKRELSVMMTNGKLYTIGTDDLEKIMCLTPGKYSVHEEERGRHFDLHIEEHMVNVYLDTAIRSTNAIIAWLHANSATVKTNKIVDKFRRKSLEIEPIHEITGSGRITVSRAMLGTDILAIAYKINGRKTTLKETIRDMARDERDINQRLDSIRKRLDQVGSIAPANAKQHLRASTLEIRQNLTNAESGRHQLEEEESIADEPISKVLHPGGFDPTSPIMWNDYSANIFEGKLLVEARRSKVATATWMSDGRQIEVILADVEARFFVSPLRPVLETERDDHIKVGDTVMLVGQYFVVASQAEDIYDGPAEFYMDNWLRIVSSEVRVTSTRGRNRRAPAQTNVLSCFR